MKRLWALKKECLSNSASRALGRIFRVIGEKHDDSFYSGLTENGLRVFFPGEGNLLGKDIQVRVLNVQDEQVIANVVGKR